MKNTVHQPDMLEIIFAGKNKAYGAYQIRRSYHDYLLRAFFVTLGLAGILSTIPRLLPINPPVQEQLIIACPGPMVNLTEKPPPPKLKIAAPPPVAKHTFRFVPPKILPNDQVSDQQKTATVDEAQKTLGAPATKTTLGDGTEEEPLVPGEAGNFYAPVPARKEAVDTIMDLITVEKMPSFPGGDAALMQFIRENLEYPAIAAESEIFGTVALSFVVGKDGNISDIKIIKEIGGGCGKEAVRVLKMMPRWTPGEANGHPVKVRFTLPVRFRLE